ATKSGSVINDLAVDLSCRVIYKCHSSVPIQPSFFRRHPLLFDYSYPSRQSWQLVSQTTTYPPSIIGNVIGASMSNDPTEKFDVLNYPKTWSMRAIHSRVSAKRPPKCHEYRPCIVSQRRMPIEPR